MCNMTREKKKTAPSRYAVSLPKELNLLSKLASEGYAYPGKMWDDSMTLLNPSMQFCDRPGGEATCDCGL